MPLLARHADQPQGDSVGSGHSHETARRYPPVGVGLLDPPTTSVSYPRFTLRCSCAPQVLRSVVSGCDTFRTLHGLAPCSGEWSADDLPFTGLVPRPISNPEFRRMDANPTEHVSVTTSWGSRRQMSYPKPKDRQFGRLSHSWQGGACKSFAEHARHLGRGGGVTTPRVYRAPFRSD